MSVRNRVGSTLLAALALAAAACDNSATIPEVGLDQPTSVAVFLGITHKTPGELRPYVAIANGGRDDLTLVDVVDGEAVLAPILVRPMVIPTSAHPIQLVSASLRDGGADLLAVVPAGTAVLQVVRTWSEDNRVVPELELDLSLVAPGAEILAAISAPVPFNGTPAAEPGRARVVLALTGARIAVVDYVRDPGGPGLVVAGAPVVQSVGFEPVSITASPDARRLFAATPDDLPAGSGVHGVVEIDAATAPGTWATSMLPTRGPTRLVAAARVQERVWAENDLAVPENAPWVLRVYATLDASGCGTGRPIDCGIVIVDPSPPVRGIVADPLGEMPYQAPIKLPAEATVLAAATPPEVPPEGFQRGRMTIFAAGGLQETTGVLVAATANGRVYTIDLARRTIWSEGRLVVDVNPDSPNRMRINNLESVVPANAEVSQNFRPIVCDRTRPADPCRLAPTIADARDAITLGPGYAFDEQMQVTYRGFLPGLAGRRAQTGDEGGLLWLAMQLSTPSGLTNVARLYDPALGVHVGDLVQIQTDDVSPIACDDGVVDDPKTPDVDESTLNVYEGRVAGFAIPDPARFPGGALLLEDDGSDCYAALRSGQSDLLTTVRADGFVMQGASTGYLGRATVTTPLGETDPDLIIEKGTGEIGPAEGPIVRYTLQYVNEDAPEQACPLSPWPASPETVGCLGECRDRCERLALARKSRRWYTLAESCESDAPCRQRWGVPGEPDEDGNVKTFTDPFPNRLGPLMDFTFTVRNPDADAPVDGKVPDELLTGHGMRVTVENPYDPNYRVPASGAAVMPAAIAPFDASIYERTASYRFYVAYTSDIVMGYSPSLSVTSTVTIR